MVRMSLGPHRRPAVTQVEPLHEFRIQPGKKFLVFPFRSEPAPNTRPHIESGKTSLSCKISGGIRKHSTELSRLEQSAKMGGQEACQRGGSPAARERQPAEGGNCLSRIAVSIAHRKMHGLGGSVFRIVVNVK